MIIARSLMLCLTAIGMLTACDPSPAPKEPTPLPPVKDTFAGDLVGTMDKARSVEATTMQQKEAMDRAIEEAADAH